MGQRVGVGGVIGRIGGEVNACGGCPVVGEDEIALGIVVRRGSDASLGTEVAGIVAKIEKIVPLLLCQCAPHSGSVATIDDGIVHAPVVIHAGCNEVGVAHIMRRPIAVLVHLVFITAQRG